MLTCILISALIWIQLHHMSISFSQREISDKLFDSDWYNSIYKKFNSEEAYIRDKGRNIIECEISLSQALTLTRNSWRPCCACRSLKKNWVHFSKSATSCWHLSDKEALTIPSIYAVRSRFSLQLYENTSRIKISQKIGNSHTRSSPDNATAFLLSAISVSHLVCERFVWNKRCNLSLPVSGPYKHTRNEKFKFSGRYHFSDNLFSIFAMDELDRNNILYWDKGD